VTAERLVAALAPVILEALDRVRAECVKAIAEVPAGPAGASGAVGPPGHDGAPGAPGRDGSDGLGFDDLGVDYDGERLVTLTFTRGAHVKRFPLVLPIPIDRGVWVASKTYVRGDVVSWKGGGWICQHEAAAGMLPGEGGVWRLAVKKGDDARHRDRGRGGESASSTHGNGAAHD
jgi:hypothetical protein